jgi:hypothetical protein
LNGFGSSDLPPGYIRIVRRCERRRGPGRWLFELRLCIVEGSVLRVLREFFSPNPNLLFPTRVAAKWRVERQARDWCTRNYLGLPVHSKRTVRPRTL